jgi:serine/threonine protein kinase/GTPase SAR1 family protein
LRTNKSLTHLNVNVCNISAVDNWKSCLRWNTTLGKLEASEGNDPQFLPGGSVERFIRTNAIISQLKTRGDHSKILDAVAIEYPGLLAEACSRGHVAAVKLLLDWGVSANMVDPSRPDATPLCVSISNDDLELVKLLLACGASADETLQQLAAQRKNQEIIALMKKMKNNILDLSDGALHNVAIDTIAEESISGLNLSNNELSAIAPKLMSKLLNMRDLTSLNLSNNALTGLPTEIGAMCALTQLNLADNHLDALPASMGNLTNLKDLNLKHNPMTTVPEEVMKKGTQRLIQYLKEIQAPTKTWNRIKLVVVGQENVGKTHLVRRLQKKEYPKNISTDGIDIQPLAISKKVEFRVYDFGGQEVFYPTHTFFLSDRALYVVVFNLVDPQSRSRVEYWLKIIRTTGGVIPCPVVLVGTHLDDPLLTPELQQDARDKCKRFKERYTNIKDICYVSCVAGDGIKELRQRLLEIAMQQKILTNLVPQSYLTLDKVINQMKVDNRPVLKWAEYMALANKCNISDQNVLIAATEFLHDVGSLIWFNQPSLKDIVILDPQWLSNVMASIVSFKANWRNGVLTHDSLPIIWKVYPESLHKTLLGILEKFEVVFPIKGEEGASVVPTMLPDDPTDLFKELAARDLDSNPRFEKVERTYKFDFLPVGFFARMIVRLYHTPELYCHDAFSRGLIATPTRVFARLEKMRPEDAAKISDDDLIRSALADGFEQGCIRFETHGTFSTLNITVWRPVALGDVNTGMGQNQPGTTDSHRDNIIIPVIDSIESLITGSFKRYEEHIKRFVVYGSKESGVVEVDFETAVKAVLAGQSSITGPKGDQVRVSQVAPDISFAHVPILPTIETIRLLGEGGFGVVYLGQWGDKQVALKELKVRNNAHVQKFREFQHEVYTMCHLSHPSLVQLYGVQLTPLRMVLEYVPGTDLMNILHDPKISDADFNWRIRMRIALDVARGLRYLQSIRPPIMHRDLRSPNVFVLSLDENADCVAKVADFGLASKVLTSLSEVLFTWQWLAPEIIESDSNAQYDERADIYSYGMLLWELASRKFPFSEFEQYISKTVEKLSEEQLNDPEFLRQLKVSGWEIQGNIAVREEYQKQKFIEMITKDGLRPSIPANTPPMFRRLIERCWLREPAARPSFDEIVRVLADLMGSSSSAGGSSNKRAWRRSLGPQSRSGSSSSTRSGSGSTLETIPDTPSSATPATAVSAKPAGSYSALAQQLLRGTPAEDSVAALGRAGSAPVVPSSSVVYLANTGQSTPILSSPAISPGTSPFDRGQILSDSSSTGSITPSGGLSRSNSANSVPSPSPSPSPHSSGGPATLPTPQSLPVAIPRRVSAMPSMLQNSPTIGGTTNASGVTSPSTASPLQSMSLQAMNLAAGVAAAAQTYSQQQTTTVPAPQGHMQPIMHVPVTMPGSNTPVMVPVYQPPMGMFPGYTGQGDSTAAQGTPMNYPMPFSFPMGTANTNGMANIPYVANPQEFLAQMAAANAMPTTPLQAPIPMTPAPGFLGANATSPLKTSQSAESILSTSQDAVPRTPSPSSLQTSSTTPELGTTTQITLPSGAVATIRSSPGAPSGPSTSSSGSIPNPADPAAAAASNPGAATGVPPSDSIIRQRAQTNYSSSPNLGRASTSMAPATSISPASTVHMNPGFGGPRNRNVLARGPGGATSSKSKPIILMRKLEPDVSKAVFSFAIAQNMVWAGQQDGNISVFANTNPPKFVTTFNANKREIFAMAFVDGSMWTGSADGSIFVWDPKKFKLRKTLKAHTSVVKVLLVIPERPGSKEKVPMVLSGDVSGTVIIWRGTNMLNKFTVEANQPINCVTFIEETQHVWLGSFKKVHVYSVMDWTRVTSFEAHGGIVSAMANSETIMWTSCSDLKALTAWDVRVREIWHSSCPLYSCLTPVETFQKLEVIKEMNDVPRICCLAAVENQTLKQKHLWGGSLDNLIYVYSFEVRIPSLQRWCDPFLTLIR